MNKLKNNQKTDFLITELIKCTINASLMTRNKAFPIYNSNNFKSTTKNDFTKDIKLNLLKYLNDFKSLDEIGHIARIEELSNYLSIKYCEILYNGRFRIGISQKLVNLFSKYMWVIGKIDKPYHCPIDSVIKLKLLTEFNKLEHRDIELDDWTKLDNINDYKIYIKFISEISEKSNLSIAEWELENWSGY